MPTLPSTLPKEAVEFARKYGILSPERNGIIREGLQATADAATGVVEGFAKSAEQAGIPSRKLTNWISDIRARNQQWNPYPGYRMGNLTDLPGLARTAATGITQSAGFLGAGAAATVAGGPLAGAAATTGVAFAQIYGREVEEFQSQMEDQELAKTLATFSALGQAAIEAVLGPEAIVRGIAKNIATGALRQTTRKLGQSVVMKAVTGGVGEGLEEFFQKYISDLAKRMGGVEVPQAPLREWWDTFAGGAIPGAILGGGGQVVENSLAAITAKPVAAQRGDLSGLEFDTGLVSRINAEREQAGQAPLAENSYAIDTEMDDQRQAAERIAEALGIQVQFVRPTNPDAAYWNGRKDGDTLYLARAENLNPVQQTLGHEFAHYMHQVTPRLAREFSDYLQTVAEDFPAYAEKLAALRKKWLNADTTSDALAAEEFMADVMGEMFLDTGFWEIVGSRDQTIAQKVMQYVIRFLDTMRQKLTGSEDVRAQIEKQIDGVRQMAAQAVAGYQAERQAQAEAVEAGPDAQPQTAEAGPDAQAQTAEAEQFTGEEDFQQWLREGEARRATEATRERREQSRAYQRMRAFWGDYTGEGLPESQRTQEQRDYEAQLRRKAQYFGLKADDALGSVIDRLADREARSGRRDARFSLAGEEDTPVGAATRVPPPQTAAPNYSRDQADYVALSGMTPQDAVYYSINEKPVGDRKLMTMIANQLDPTRKGWSKHTAETKRQAKQVLDDLFSNTPGMNEFIEATLALKEFYPEMSTKAFPKNSDPTYAITIDSVGACVRMMRAFPVDKYIRQELGKKLTSAQRQAVRAELNKAGHALQCIYCYAFTRRANAQAKTEAMINGLRSGQPVALEAAAAEKRESLEKLWKAAIKEARKNPSWEEDLRALPDIFQIKSASVEALEVASVDAAAWARQYPAIFALRQKITDPGNMRLPGIDTAVAGQIATLPKKMISALKRWGGLRWQSSIDFVPAFAYDYVMGIFEMAMGKIPGHVYTKEIDLVRLWGDNGMKINLSAAPRVRNGKAVWDRKRNMPMIDPSIGSMLAEEIDEAMRLAPDHAGVMMLVPSDDVFEWLVTSESKYAHYGIPFHASGMPTFVAEAFYDTKTRTGSPIGAKDYTDPHETVRAYPTVEDMPEALRPLAVPLVDKAGEDTGFLVVAYEKIGTVYPELAWVGKWYDQERKAHVNSGTKANPVHPDSRPTSLNLPTGDIIDQETGVSDAEATRLYFDLLDRLDLGPQFEESFLKGYMERHGGTRPPYYWRIKKHYARTDTPFAPPDPGKMNFKHGEKLNQTFIQSPMGKAIKASMAMGQNMPVIDSYRHRELSAKEKAEIDRAVEKVLAAENPVRSVYEEGTPSYSLSDADYLAAVEAGDMATAQRMVNRAAKAAGYTVGPVWHGTPAEFTTFVERSRPKRDEMFSFGFHFTDAPELSAEYGPRQVNAYLKAESPLDTEQVVYRDSDLGQWLSKIAPRTRWFPSDGREAVYLRNALDAMPGRRAKQAVMDAGYDAILYKATLANNNPMGFREVGATGDATIVFAPSQIKSADPVTYDDAGNVIPLSKRFDPANEDIRYSLADRDAPYLKAVEAGDMDTAQKLVDEAAKAAGYTTEAYRGSPNANLGTYPGSDGAMIFVAKDKELAAIYGEPRRVYVRTGKAFDASRGEDYEAFRRFESERGISATGGGRGGFKGTSIAPHWTAEYDLRQFLDREGIEYDALYIGENTGESSLALREINQIKSAEPVTYDDSGRVIPLSERFNPQSDDIRYSLADRPLANPAIRPGPRATVDYVDQLRAAEGLPGRQTVAEWQAEADSMVEQDGDRLWADLAAGRLNMDDPVNTMVAKRLLDERVTLDTSQDSEALRETVAAVKAYRAGRSQIARAMRAGFDPVRPADPNSVYRQVMGLIRAAVLDPGKLDEVDIETIRKRLVKLKAALRKKGIDLDNLTPQDVARPEDRARIVREVQTAKAGFGDMAYEWWINGLLSLPTTHASNILGNTAYAVSDLTLQRAVEATLNLVARKKNAATWGEFRSMAEAFRGNLRTAFRNAAQAWETERPVTGTSQKLEGPVKAAIPGRFGRAVRAPGRALLWADEVAKSLIVPIEAAAFAHRQAKAEGLTGAALEARVRELAGNRDGDAVAYAQNRALEMTFQARPGQIVSHLLNIRENGGVAGTLVKYTLPFLTTPTNILKTTVRKSPLGTLSFTGRLATGGYKGDAGRAIRDAAEQILAWGVVGTIASLYDDDDEPVITGARPQYGTGEYDAAQRGIPSQSIRIGDRWYSYARLEPFAGILTMIVDSLEAMRMAKNGAEGEKIVRHLVNSAKQNVRDKTFLQTVGDLVRATEDPKSAGRLVSSFVASWMPNAIRGTIQRLDENLPDRRNYSRGLEYWKDQFSTQVLLDAGLVRAEPKVDVWGREIERGERLGYTTDVIWRLMSPVYTKVPQDNPLDELLYTWNRENPNDSYWPGMPLPRVVVRGKTLWMKGGEYRRFAKDAGKLARERLERMVRSGKLNPRAPTEEDIKVIKSEIAKARATARKRLLSRMGL